MRFEAICSPRNIIFTTVLLLFSFAVKGQQGLYIKPSIGLQVPISHILDKSLADDSFVIYNKIFEPDFGLSLQYSWNNKNSISFGYHSNSLSTGFKFGTEEGGTVTKTITSRSLRVFPICYERYISTARLFQIKKAKETNSENDNYLFLFQFNLFGGLSYYYLPASTGDNQVQIRSFGDSIIENTILTYSNMGIFIGISLQFFNYKRNTINTSLLFSQGVFRQLTETIDYRYESPNFDYQAVVGSRGTYFVIQLGYPIPIWKR